MKIIQVIYSLVPGGAERFVVDLSNELARDNKVLLYTLRDDSINDHAFYLDSLNKQIEYFNLKIKPGFKPYLIWLFYKILRQHKPDVVHCHLNLVNYFFFSALILRKKIKFLYTVHNPPSTEVQSEVERQIRRFFFKHKLFVPVAISDETKKSCQEFYKLSEIDVIYNGRRDEGPSGKTEEVKHEIELLKRTKKTLVFCHLSRYDKIQKNQIMLIRVFNRLMEEGYDVTLLVIGSGFEEASQLKNEAKSHIHFLGVKSNVNDYLLISDAFCLSSSFEGMPISLLEAFACGCIPVCTPVGGIVDLVKNGVTGFVSKSIGEDDYYNSLLQFIKEHKNINRENLKKIFYNNYSIEHCTKQYIDLFKI